MSVESMEVSINVTNEENAENSKVANKKCSESDVDSDSFQNHNLKFEHQLKDKPEILDFIIKQGKRVKKLEKKIKKLKSKLKKCTKVKTESVGTQTDSINEVEAKSLTEEITEAAEDAMHKTGFVYEATSGMYYDYNTGYYYNAELGLYYDGNSGKYLKYNSATDSYEFHSQCDVHREEKDFKRKKHRTDQVKNYSIDGLLQNFSQLSIDQSRSNALEYLKQWPPCMRIILKETTIEKMKIGSLFIITCDGGTIGREGDHSIIIPDINVSKSHAKITFDSESGNYVITDIGSQNGTILNGKRISSAKTVSEPQIIVHGSVIQFGTTKFLCHIHDGQKTCGHCEPGLIQIEKPPTVQKTAKKSKQHKQELERLRKKYGLDETTDINSQLPVGYSDRAKERRDKLGSVNGNEKTKVASVHESISSDNKGFKLLSKMGWNEGQSLGKTGGGILEPVPLVSNEGTTGLGSAVPCKPSCSDIPDRKVNMWKKTQQRFAMVQTQKHDMFNESESEAEASAEITEEGV